MVKINPFGSNILVQPIEKKTPLGSGPLCEYGRVVAVGESVEKVKVDDQIGFLVWGVNSLIVDGKKYYFIKETDDFILGKFELSGDLASQI